jgi:hypothetical protein
MYSVQQLKALAKSARAQRNTLRDLFTSAREQLAATDSAEQKRMYTPEHLRVRREKLRTETLSAFRERARPLLESISPAVRERDEHSRLSYLRATLSPPTPAKDELTETLRELKSAVVSLTMTTKLSRLDNAMLGATAEHAARTKDAATLLACMDEVQTRPDGQTRLRVESAVNAVDLPDLAEATEALDFLDGVVRETVGRERHLANPEDQIAFSAWRSVEISEEQKAREYLEREEAAKKAKPAAAVPIVPQEPPAAA